MLILNNEAYQNIRNNFYNIIDLVTNKHKNADCETWGTEICLSEVG